MRSVAHRHHQGVLLSEATIHIRLSLVSTIYPLPVRSIQREFPACRAAPVVFLLQHSAGDNEVMMTRLLLLS